MKKNAPNGNVTLSRLDTKFDQRRQTRAQEMHAYNPTLDRVSDGAKHAQAWASYKQNGGEFGGADKKVDGQPEESDVKTGVKKEYGKHYPSVWTKDPHGGPYRIDKGPGASKGYDALEQKSDGTLIERPAGYEKPQSGPTTNFVGNHMTQGAIDLVQYELTKIDPNQELRRQRLIDARGIDFKPPALLSVTQEASSTVGMRQKIESFSWYDDSDTIRISVPISTLGEVDCSDASLTCTETSALIEIPKAMLSESNVKDTYVLHLKRLFSTIDPDKSRCGVEKQNLVIHLAKNDSETPWKTLEIGLDAMRALPTQPSASSDVATTQPNIDLRTLRCQVISAREGKLASNLMWLKSQTDGAIEEEDGLEFIPANEAVRSVQMYMNAGDYSSALVAASCGLMDANINLNDKIDLLMQRAKVHVQIGALKAAVSDYDEVIKIEPSLMVLIQSATIYEQLEDYEGALEVYANALQLDSSCSKVHSAVRRVKRLLEQKNIDKAEAKQRKTDDGNKSVPRPCLPQFENRGKAGACF